ncbi:MAG TPA: GIY-YIG nuclease family protein [Candidatus Desulfaltia sp.]|nr:GIY-YIG nuclease family protein [Candidatus Desulfaltia sp.]
MVLRGTYCLCIGVAADMEVRVGALGLLAFPRGRYVYVGSALNSLEPRIIRHLRTSESAHHVTHWHIDYLLREHVVTLSHVYYTETDQKVECLLASRVAEHGEPVKGFGCSDCKCSSHLYKVDHWGFLEKMDLKKWVKGSPQLPE